MKKFQFCCSVVAMLCLLSAGPVSAGEKILHVGSPWAVKTLDVNKQGYAFLRLGITETLVGVDKNVKLVPSLATSWTTSEDKKTWTFTIREKVLFHDGTAFTASAMETCLNRLMEKGKLLKNVPVVSIKAKDNKTLVIVTSEPFSPLPAYLSTGETAALAPSSFDAEGNIVKPVSTGPFMFESWKMKKELVAVRHSNYWGDVKAKVDRVIYRGVPDAMTRLAMLRAGELDIAQILPPSDIKTLEADPEITTVRQAIGRCRMAGLNLEKAPFDDLNVRLAVNYAINRDDLVAHVLEGVGESATTLYPPTVYWANGKLPGFPYDPEKAGQLLDKAGWKDSDGDGIRDKNGQPLSFKLVTYPERAALPPTAEVIQSQLQKVGIRAELTVLQVDAAHQMRDDGDFGMHIVGRGLLFVPDPDYNMMLDYYSPNTFKSGWGAFHYKNGEIDGLLKKGREAFRPEDRKVIYDRIQEILAAEAPVAYLNYYVNVDGVRKGVKNYRIHPTERSFMLEYVDLD